MSMTSAGRPLVYAADTVVGRVREHNEDAVLCCPELGLWAVADGMGGHRRGEVASALALQALRSACAAGAELEAAVHAANRAVVATAEADEACRGMGTTLVALRLRGADFQLAWVGDSRAYRVGAAHIERLSHDHSWVQALIDAGELSEAEARDHPQRNLILQCLGRDDAALAVGLAQGRLGERELLLLCSDGLTGELSDAQIQQQCAGATTLPKLVTELIGLANSLGGRDNISCVALGLAPGAGPASVEARRPRGLLGRLFKPGKP